MASVNKVILIGNLGQDPELKHTPSGQTVCSLSVATNEQWTDKDGNKQERTEWHRVSVWGKTAENCAQYLAKGRQVCVEGRLKSRKYTDKDGVERTVWEIDAQNVTFLAGGSGDRADGAPQGRQNQGNRQHTGGGGDGAFPQPNQKSGDDGFGDDPFPF